MRASGSEGDLEWSHGSPRLPTTINLIGFTESTKDFRLQKPGQPFLFNGLGSLGVYHGMIRRWVVMSSIPVRWADSAASQPEVDAVPGRSTWKFFFGIRGRSKYGNFRNPVVDRSSLGCTSGFGTKNQPSPTNVADDVFGGDSQQQHIPRMTSSMACVPECPFLSKATKALRGTRGDHIMI